MLIELSISKNYVSHWSYWEAIRELIQNAIDVDQQNYSVSADKSAGKLLVKSYSTLNINTSALLLGNTSKVNNDSSIGKYGEGFKLALVVLLRNNVKIGIKNGLDVWVPKFKYSEVFNDECLTIEIKENCLHKTSKNVVEFELSNIPEDILNSLNDKFIDLRTIENDYQVIGSIAENNEYCFVPNNDTPSLYINGLFVCELKGKGHNFKYSYCFPPNKISLDRDRNKVSNIDIAWETVVLLALTNPMELTNLISQEYDDVKYYSVSKIIYNNYSSYGYTSDKNLEIIKTLSKKAYNEFIERFGENAFPIDPAFTSNEKILITKKIIDINKIPVEINAAWYNMIKEIFEDFDFFSNIQKQKKFYEVLEEIKEEYVESLPESLINKLDILIDEYQLLDK